ncbi:hypothetical protein BaRGS_00003615 [Batillaria attramentaria]|uniref:Uncharacterized protein n=1 Tax=Batillaria attramentaria TaxID=370345 RepID=A0ABD0LZV0_9CAEN
MTFFATSGKEENTGKTKEETQQETAKNLQMLGSKSVTRDWLRRGFLNSMMRIFGTYKFSGIFPRLNEIIPFYEESWHSGCRYYF